MPEKSEGTPLRAVVIAALAIAVAVIAYLLLGGGDDGGGDLQTPRIVSPDQLADLPGELGHEVAARPQSISSRLKGGGIAVSNKKTATSAYVAYPGSHYQVEVYDPERGEALGLAITGKVVEVG
jgi:hypothetical protein